MPIRPRSTDMAWSEAKAWLKGSAQQDLYQQLLDDAASAPARNAKRKKVVQPEDMPWEMARQGLLKHLLNEGMNTRMETVDAYMQIIPPGSRSGKHRHLAEECLYVRRRAAATTCTRTATSRSPTPTTGRRRPRSSATSGRRAT